MRQADISGPLCRQSSSRPSSQDRQKGAGARPSSRRKEKSRRRGSLFQEPLGQVDLEYFETDTQRLPLASELSLLSWGSPEIEFLQVAETVAAK
jgi:hypothetical protein